MISRDGHIRVLPLHVANKIAAGEVVERPASVVKELVENAIDAGAHTIRITITQGGRKLVSVQDDGCGMSRDDAVLSLERQATSKILDVNDIEQIDTLGFRGEAIPSIASVSRFTITTRTRESDEGTRVQVNAGQLVEVSAAGCPPGTCVEVRDLFCNVPARRKFLRAFTTEENHIRHIFMVHALAHPTIGFTLVIDGRETYRLAPSATCDDRIFDLFGGDFKNDLLAICEEENPIKDIHVSGFIEKPNLNQPTRRDQFVFVNGRPASASAITYALREAYPRRAGDVRPATILFINLPPNQVDVNVHPTKREVRFRENVAVREAITRAVTKTFFAIRENRENFAKIEPTENRENFATENFAKIEPIENRENLATQKFAKIEPFANMMRPSPVQVEFAIEPDSTASKPWQWFRFLAQTSGGFLLLETDSGLVTIHPQAARERIAYESLLNATEVVTQNLLIPDIAQFSPSEASRIRAALPSIRAMGFAIEEFGRDTFKIDAVPQLIGSCASSNLLATIAHDLSEASARRTNERWREEIIAKSVAKSFAGMQTVVTEEIANRLVAELCACRMPYVCPRGKPIMIFTSNRELNRKFARD